MASVTMPELRCRQQEGRSAPHASSPQPSCKRSSYGLSNMQVFRKVGAIAKDRLVHLTKVNPSNVWRKHLRRPGCQNPFKFVLKIRLMDEGLCSGNQTSSPQVRGVRDR